MTQNGRWQDPSTEAINTETLGIDTMPVLDIIDLIGQEDRKVVSAVHRERIAIAHGVDLLVDGLKRGGRIFFVGAGTSGRLGVIEATEMPSTFGTPPSLVQAVMAGGQDAIFKTREGVEDNFEEGSRSIPRLRVTKRDVVVGVSASGFTPFVRGALIAARKRGARIIFVTCQPGSELETFVDLVIAPAVGPEVIAGSTRLKAGTATKMVLNMLTTIAMVRIGKTYGNLMVDVQTGSEQRRRKACRIVAEVTGLDKLTAVSLLKRAKWNVKAALVMHQTQATYAQAVAKLKKAENSVRTALGSDLATALTQRGRTPSV
jgi:N-acetylmuramic acid 6-phosphate etherase